MSSGDTAQVGKELVKAIDPRSMRLEGLVSADRLHELRVGQRVSFRINGYPQTEFAGTIRRIDAAANATTRQVEVLVAFAGSEAPRVAGLYAEGRIESGTTRVLTVPESSVLRAGDNTQVWRVQAQVLQKVVVQLGERDPRRGEYPVITGLADGDRVLRNPAGTLIDGQKVEFAAAVASSASPAAKP